MDINTKKKANTNTEDPLNIYSATQWWSRMFELFVNSRQYTWYTWLVIFLLKKITNRIFPLMKNFSFSLSFFMSVIAKVGVLS